MELKSEYYTLNTSFKSQLYFNQSFNKKINELTIFIYGLRGVTKYK